jgi:competence ComEA-like helix-hairpin-helix protein
MKTHHASKIASTVTVFALALCFAGAAAAHGDPKQATDRTAAAAEGVVNVNTATAAQLTLLPGVGPSRAEAIIQARERRPFRALNELARVRGIGRATLQQLRPYVTMEGETTLNRSVPMSRNSR